MWWISSSTFNQHLQNRVATGHTSIWGAWNTAKWWISSSLRSTFWEFLFAYCLQIETCGMGGHPERLCMAREESGDPKDDGRGRCRHQAVGWLCGTGWYWKAEGMCLASCEWQKHSWTHLTWGADTGLSKLSDHLLLQITCLSLKQTQKAKFRY